MAAVIVEDAAFHHWHDFAQRQIAERVAWLRRQHEAEIRAIGVRRRRRQAERWRRRRPR